MLSFYKIALLFVIKKYHPEKFYQTLCLWFFCFCSKNIFGGKILSTAGKTKVCFRRTLFVICFLNHMTQKVAVK